MVGVPHNGTLTYGAIHGLLNPSKRHDAMVVDYPSSLLAAGFNVLWCRALNAFEQGKITHLAFLHADIAPSEMWVDKLVDEMDGLGADFVSVVVPIKDRRGLTSTGIGDPSNAWMPFRRFTMREIMAMPETFDAASAGYPDKYLLHNSGCWVADLRRPVFRGDDVPFFTINDKIVREGGVWRTVVEPEDWCFSRMLWERCAKTFATRKVCVVHYGLAGFGNACGWGEWEHDVATRKTWGPQ